MKPFLLLLSLTFSNLLSAQSKFEKDFNEFWNVINNHYAYFDQQNINWNRVNEIYTPKAKEIGTEKEFVQLLENVLHELHNGHVSLSKNLRSSNRLIPTGQDVYVEENNGKFYITDIRKGSGAALSGLQIGSEVVLFNGKPVSEQLDRFLPKSTSNHTPDMYAYALNMLFAGTHDTKRKITINQNGNQTTFYPDSVKVIFPEALLEKKVLSKRTAYIKINNSLGNNNLIAEFDKAIDEYMGFKNLVIDLTETPSGGNTTVARSMMGRFTTKTLPYQQHEFDEKEFQTKRKWVEYVTPRKSTYKGKVFVLVGHWTGSMGEGIAIGFDGMKRAKIIGTKIAGLIGAINGFTMTETGIGFQIPTERLYHINGTPREKYVPDVLAKNTEETFDYLERIK